ncbi:hypothetical protein NPIL_56741, partial [Nephila pilipes]
MIYEVFHDERVLFFCIACYNEMYWLFESMSVYAVHARFGKRTFFMRTKLDSSGDHQDERDESNN